MIHLLFSFSSNEFIDGDCFIYYKLNFLPNFYDCLAI